MSDSLRPHRLWLLTGARVQKACVICVSRSWWRITGWESEAPEIMLEGIVACKWPSLRGVEEWAWGVLVSSPSFYRQGIRSAERLGHLESEKLWAECSTKAFVKSLCLNPDEWQRLAQKPASLALTAVQRQSAVHTVTSFSSTWKTVQCIDQDFIFTPE